MTVKPGWYIHQKAASLALRHGPCVVRGVNRADLTTDESLPGLIKKYRICLTSANGSYRAVLKTLNTTLLVQMRTTVGL